MKKNPFKKSAWVFFFLVLAELLAIASGLSWMEFIAKPLLMPVLAFGLISSRVSAPGKGLLITGLFFSWLGDIFLLIEPGNMLFFIAGLFSFLITHACYIIYFLSTRSDAPSFLKKQPIFILLVICYGAGLVWLLFPYLGELKIPVIIYAATICSMLLCSIHIYLKVKTPSNKYFISGALLFVLSDSILAVNKFYSPIPFAGEWIMASYCAAQYFIVAGFIDGKRGTGGE